MDTSQASNIELHLNNNLSTEERLIAVAENAGNNAEFSFCITGDPLPLYKTAALKTIAEILAIIGNRIFLRNLHFTRNNSLIITVKSLESAKSISKITEFQNKTVTVRLLIEPITTKFLIRDIPTDISLGDISAELSLFKTIPHHLRRFTKKNSDGKYYPTESILVTSYGTSIPDDVFLLLQRQKIKPFLDYPRICSKCGKFNHATSKCKSIHIICLSCGESHESQTCTSQIPICVNCKLNHPAEDKKCPFYLKECEIIKYKCQNHLSFPEARRKFQKNNSIPTPPTYANILAGNSVSPSLPIQSSQLSADISIPSDVFSKHSDPMVAALAQQVQTLTHEVIQLKIAIAELVSSKNSTSFKIPNPSTKNNSTSSQTISTNGVKTNQNSTQSKELKRKLPKKRTNSQSSNDSVDMSDYDSTISHISSSETIKMFNRGIADSIKTISRHQKKH